jgi:hypothetical protein
MKPGGKTFGGRSVGWNSARGTETGCGDILAVNPMSRGPIVR